MLGYDFGVKERKAVVVDPAYVKLLGDREAIAYGQVPTFGLLVDAPGIYFVFSNDTSAKRCFEIFADWIGRWGQDGDVVDVVCIEFEDGSYGVATGPDMTRILNSPMYSDDIEDFDIMFLASYKMITIPMQSDAYRFFRSIAEGRPVVVAPMTRSSGPMLELAFRKREIAFFKESDVPRDHPVSGLLHQVEDGRGVATALRRSSQEIRARRRSQLKRFFPVTCERLRLDASFNELVQVLAKHGFVYWEVVQAVCNLALRHRHPRLFAPVSEANEAPQSVLEFLRDRLEGVDEERLPSSLLAADAIEGQAHLDRRYLLSMLTEPSRSTEFSNETVAIELRSLGVLDSDG